ncbi:MAG: hypothetical protein MUC50_04260 [Myxococcota bacterium]|jgi:Cu-processing system permease protein|nr:hypothetical protein [Myxococcota bacterium]
MRATLCVAWDVLLEARQRKWVLALAVGITLVFGLFGAFLRLDVVDGALAASRMFGGLLSDEIQPVDVALRPVFGIVSMVMFWLGMLLGILVTADFAPALLAPGRIEHLLSLPVRRIEVVVGLWLGVMGLVVAASLYGGLGVVLIFGVKTGYFTMAPLLASLAGCLCFAAVYSAMLAAALFVRSVSLSAVAGGLVCIAGIVSSQKEAISAAFDPGIARTLFFLGASLWPRILDASLVSAGFAGQADAAGLGRLLAGHGLFAAAMLFLGVWRFEGRDL